MRVVLGNRNAVQGRPGPDGEPELVEMGRGKRATHVGPFPDGTTVAEAFQIVAGPNGAWHSHAAEGAKPAWVASDSPALASILAEHFGDVEVRELEDESSGGGGGGGGAVAAAMLPLMLAMVFALFRLAMPFLKTNAGNDFQAAQMAGAASATAVAKWVALTANTTAPAATDTTLTGEITTAGGGLIRKVGTYAHTTGAASYTITTVFTANGSDSLPVTIGKRAHFDAASGGNMVFSTLVTPTATLSASGDTLTLTDTVTL